MRTDRAATQEPPRRLRCEPRLRWVVERRGLLLLAEGREAVCSIPYPAAVIWDLMSRGYTYDKIVAMIGSIAAIDGDTSRRYVASVLQNWLDAGFLLEDDHG